MGAVLADLGPPVDRILSSSATRALETAELVLEEMGWSHFWMWRSCWWTVSLLGTVCSRFMLPWGCCGPSAHQWNLWLKTLV